MTTIREEAERIAREVVELLGRDPLRDGPHEPFRPGEEDALDGATFELGDAAGFDVEAIRAARRPVRIDDWTLVDYLMSGAQQYAVISATPDEDRASHLLRIMAGGMPPSRQSFAPRHVRLALELLDGRGAAPGTRERLEAFEAVACALV